AGQVGQSQKPQQVFLSDADPLLAEMLVDEIRPILPEVEPRDVGRGIGHRTLVRARQAPTVYPIRAVYRQGSFLTRFPRRCFFLPEYAAWIVDACRPQL